MFEIYQTGKNEFFQWDINQKIVIEAPVGTQVQFERPDDDTAAVMLAYDLGGMTVVDVPNILLQTAMPFRMWLMQTKNDMTATRRERIYHVRPRQKPDDYVYEETEVHAWQELEERVRALEENGGGGGVSGQDGGYYTPSVEQMDGDTLRIRYAASKGSMPAVGDVDVTLPRGPQGDKGPAGKTPVKGTDYYTEADVAEMVERVVGAMPGETDPTVPAWAKQPEKPAYTKAEVGLGNVDDVRQYSASNPPPYPVTSVNGQTGAVTLAAESAVRLITFTKDGEEFMPTCTLAEALADYEAGKTLIMRGPSLTLSHYFDYRLVAVVPFTSGDGLIFTVDVSALLSTVGESGSLCMVWDNEGMFELPLITSLPREE